MKKETELTLARKENDNGSSREDITNPPRESLTKQPSANSNIYTDT
jgi:hypothetical protein